MVHTVFKAKEYKLVGKAKSYFDNIQLPEEGKKIIEAYKNPKVTIEDLDKELGLLFEDRFVFGYDYIFGDRKLFLPEIDPVSVFFSNAVMFMGMINQYRKELLDSSIEVGNLIKALTLKLQACTCNMLLILR